MSTSYTYFCPTHNAQVRDHEGETHTTDISRFAESTAVDELRRIAGALYEFMNHPLFVRFEIMGVYGFENVVAFWKDHQDCPIELVDEYDKRLNDAANSNF